MRRSLLLAAVLSVVIVGCSGPLETAGTAALFTDLDLERAESISDISGMTATAADHAVDGSNLVSGSFNGARSLAAASIESLAGHGRTNKDFSAGGYLVYVEYDGRD